MGSANRHFLATALRFDHKISGTESRTLQISICVNSESYWNSLSIYPYNFVNNVSAVTIKTALDLCKISLKISCDKHITVLLIFIHCITILLQQSRLWKSPNCSNARTSSVYGTLFHNNLRTQLQQSLRTERTLWPQLWASDRSTHRITTVSHQLTHMRCIMPFWWGWIPRRRYCCCTPKGKKTKNAKIKKKNTGQWVEL